MPTLFIIFGYRFFFWSNEHDPIHVHIKKGDGEARYNLDSNEFVFNHGFKSNEMKMIESIIMENKEVIVGRWKEFFKKNK